MEQPPRIIRDGPNRDFYLKKRGEGCKHVQAVIALARRRVGALWALLRDDRVFPRSAGHARGLTTSFIRIGMRSSQISE